MKILIAEDDRISRMLLAKLLNNKGMDTIEATNGEEALELYKNENTNIVLIDWMMPKMNGIRLIKKIKDHDRIVGRKSYLIVVTAKMEKNDMLYALEAGADDFISKPYDSTILLNRVKIGEWSINPLDEKERDPTKSPLARLIKEHETILSIANIFEAIKDDLEKGVPNFVLEWATSAAMLLNMEVHEEKEEVSISTFIDKLLLEQGKLFKEISESPFNKVREEHQRLETLVLRLRGHLESYLEKKSEALIPFDEALRSYDGNENVENLEHFVADLQMKLGYYQVKQKEALIPLKETIEEYITLVRKHIALEENAFFPFTSRYLDKHDNERIMLKFEKIDDRIGLDELRKHTKEVNKLVDILKSSSNKSD